MTSNQQDVAAETCACGHDLLLHDGGEECTAPGCPCAWFYEGRSDFTMSIPARPERDSDLILDPVNASVHQLTAALRAVLDLADQMDAKAVADGFVLDRIIPPGEPIRTAVAAALTPGEVTA